MPLKVRCKGCRKVLTVPDRARGKVVKCPNCETRIRVPQQAQAKQKQTAAARAPESDGFLSGLDLDKAEDSRVRLCPRCGIEVADDDVECPNCEVDLSTGQLSEQALVRRGRKGPDPALFFQTMRSDAWAFLMGHKKIAVRTIIYTIVSTALSFGCLWMALWVGKIPLKVFWGFGALVTGMVAPGWAWFLHTEIIKLTLAKKKKIKKIRFDFFLTSALGIKFFAWLFVFSLPVQIVTGGIGVWLWFTGMPIAGMISVGIGFVIAMLMFPIVMVHMSMPVTGRGWLFPTIARVFSRTVAPVLYWQVFFVLMMSPIIGGVVTIGALSGQKLARYANTMEVNSEIAAAKAYEKGKSETLSARMEALRAREETAVDHQVLILPAAIWFGICIPFGFAAVFNMRSNGLFAYYFKGSLELIDRVKGVVYVAKTDEQRLAEEKAKKDTSVGVVWALGVLTIVGCVGAGIYTGNTLIWVGIGLGIFFAVWLPMAGLWRIFEKTGEPGWAIFVPVYSFVVLARISGKPEWWALLLMIPIPIVQFIFMIIVHLGIAERFGKGAGYAVGMVFLPWIFYPLLGLGDAVCER